MIFHSSINPSNHFLLFTRSQTTFSSLVVNYYYVDLLLGSSGKCDIIINNSCSHLPHFKLFYIKIQALKSI